MALVDLILRLQKGEPLTNQEMDDNLSNLATGIDQSSCDWAGPLEPEETFPYLRWIDTSTNPPTNKIRNAEDDSWITLGSATTPLGTAATRDVGTGPNEVPTNSDLGSAAILDAIGTAPLYGRDSILGTVSQSGGVPTGAIIERGSNANGEYVKFADGTLICYSLIGFTTSATPAMNITSVFPASFVDPEGVVLSAMWRGGAPSQAGGAQRGGVVDTTQAEITVGRYDGQNMPAGLNRILMLLSVGRYA